MKPVGILYVEDDRMSRVVMDILLKKIDYVEHVHIMEDSHDFVERIEALDPKPDIVFLDIHVPPINGFEMLAILRDMNDYADKPVIALTASVMNEEIQQLEAAGFTGCIAKPINSKVFPDLLNRILNNQDVWHIVSS